MMEDFIFDSISKVLERDDILLWNSLRFFYEHLNKTRLID